MYKDGWVASKRILKKFLTQNTHISLDNKDEYLSTAYVNDLKGFSKVNIYLHRHSH